MSNDCAPTFNLSRVPNELVAEMAICGPFWRCELSMITEVEVHSADAGAEVFDPRALYCIGREDSTAGHIRTGPSAVWAGISGSLAAQARARGGVLRPFPPVAPRSHRSRCAAHRLLPSHAYGHAACAAVGSTGQGKQSFGHARRLRPVRAPQRITSARGRLFGHLRSRVRI